MSTSALAYQAAPDFLFTERAGKSETSTFSYLEAGCDAAFLGDFASVKTLWDARRDDQPAPSWQAFSIADFEGWFPFMARTEATTSRDDVVFRYFGSGLVDLNGADYTGQSFRDIAPEAFKKYIQNHWAAFFERPQIAIGRAQALNRHDNDVFFDLILLPLVDGEGVVTGALHFSQRV